MLRFEKNYCRWRIVGSWLWLRNKATVFAVEASTRATVEKATLKLENCQVKCWMLSSNMKILCTTNILLDDRRSTKIVLCDIWLFPELEMLLKEHKFKDKETILENATNQMTKIHTSAEKSRQVVYFWDKTRTCPELYCLPYWNDYRQLPILAVLQVDYSQENVSSLLNSNPYFLIAPN